MFATFLFTHNSQIAIFAFALGFAFAVPTVLLILYNGLMLGAFFAVFAAKGLASERGRLADDPRDDRDLRDLHFRRGGDPDRHRDRLPRPRIAHRTRRSRPARSAATAMAGTVIMLAVAGLLEGVGRQTDQQRRCCAMLIGTAVLAGWLAYFYALAGAEALVVAQ